MKVITHTLYTHVVIFATTEHILLLRGGINMQVLKGLPIMDNGVWTIGLKSNTIKLYYVSIVGIQNF